MKPYIDIMLRLVSSCFYTFRHFVNYNDVSKENKHVMSKLVFVFISESSDEEHYKNIGLILV